MTEPSRGPSRLFGLPGAETLETDITSVYEMHIDPYFDDPDRRSWTVEEWTVQPTGSAFRSAESIVTWLIEDAADDAPEGFWDTIEHLDRDPAVLATAEALRAALIEHGGNYWIADKLVAEHTITWDEDGEPLVNGERLYQPSVERIPAHPSTVMQLAAIKAQSDPDNPANKGS